MGLIGDALQALFDFAEHLLTTTGLWGLFLLMVAESMFLPVPSEAVMPFAGVLAHQDGSPFSPIAVFVVSTLASLVGSFIGYGMGRYGFLPLMQRYGKYVLVQRHHLDGAQRYFERRGTLAVFLCRFIPGVRHVSSIPAGAARMPVLPFAAATAIGAATWNMLLYWVGYRYGEAVMARLKPSFDLVGIALLVLLGLYIWYEVRKGRKAKAASPDETAAR